MTLTVEKRITLEVIELLCGHYAALPGQVWADLQQKGGSVYCPYGHTWSYIETENARLKRELAEAQERTNAAATREQAARRLQERAEKSLGLLKRRANAGVCPHCHRTFQQVQRHMANKHPEAKP